METNYNLEAIANLIAEAAGTIANLDERFQLIYLIDNVSEANLIDLGFEFQGTSFGANTYPTYKLGNIFAMFKGEVLQVMQSSN